MSNTVQQKLGSLQAAEQNAASSLQPLMKTAQDPQLKEALQKLNSQTFERVSSLGTVLGALKIQAEPQSNSMVEGITKELESYAQAQPGSTTDTNIANGLQKLISTLATDYSYTANIVNEQEKNSQAVSSLSDSFQKLQKLNEELSTIAQQLFKKLGSDQSSQTDNSAQKPGMMEKVKQAATSARDTLTS